MEAVKQLEKQVFKGYWSDGVADCLMGVSLVVAGVGWGYLGPVAVLQIPLWMVVWLGVRKGWVERTGGYVRFSKQREQRNAVNLKALWVLGAGGLGAAVLSAFWASGAGWSWHLETWIVVLPAALVSLAMWLLWGITGIQRLILYGCSYFFAGIVACLLGMEPGFSLVLGSILPVVAGCLLWRAFWKECLRCREFSGQE